MFGLVVAAMLFRFGLCFVMLLFGSLLLLVLFVGLWLVGAAAGCFPIVVSQPCCCCLLFLFFFFYGSFSFATKFPAAIFLLQLVFG
ncbi:hypothetical protein OWV82_010598 [Melia azedarach]|uniref:Uncharacterized protein n=1 Tax=Melia azedarach TaxID=155640 RepID=A0ACC1Y5H5_MELAZ|nr:hypothetical protein OWV82_010598 [Melia azedarach]